MLESLDHMIVPGEKPSATNPEKLYRRAGTCHCKGSTDSMTSRTRDQGAERRAETVVSGRLLLQRMHYYRVLAKDRMQSCLIQ